MVEQVMGQCCGSCRFYRVLPNEECRRLPPKVFLIPGSHGPMPISAFPPVRKEQWCGDWSPRVSPS